MSKPVFLVVSILTEIIIGEPGVVAQQANSSPVKLQSDTNSLSRPSGSNSHPALCKPTREKQQETKCLGPCCRVEDTEAVPAWPTAGSWVTGGVNQQMKDLPGLSLMLIFQSLENTYYLDFQVSHTKSLKFFYIY